MSDTENHREFSRANVKIAATFVTDGQAYAGEAQNVSANGVFVACANPPAVGTSCEVTLRLAANDTGPTVKAQGTVTRSDDAGVAIQFHTIVSQKSWEHLRNLVRHNAEDIQQIETELASHIGLKRRNAD